MINIGIIGYGYWGPNLVRNFNSTSGVNVTWVTDIDQDKLKLVKSRYPSTLVSMNTDEAIESSNVDAIAIATPVSSHFELALKALQAGKHVLVEKPMAVNSQECERLIDEADKRKLTLMVDHTFPYTGAVRKIKELVDGGQLGEIYYFDSVRVNLGLFQHDINVIWDLAVHDLSTLDFLFDQKPVEVSATGMRHISGQPENVAYITLFFPNNLIAHIHVNWLSPVKVRKTLIGGSKKMIVYDDLSIDEKVKIYDKGVSMSRDEVNIYKMKVDYRIGEMHSPSIDGKEALKNLTNHFRNCIDKKENPITSSLSGLRVVKTLKAVEKSMENKGRLEKIK
jgi:predicted dehydrogenase|tara:strand:+ start:394 stop:1404 length:1011 start_codon:yes stop_codon:yes gene_type:complete